jgi:TPR repeat protein
MNNEDEKTTSLVPSPSSALSRVGSTSLVQRGMQDRLAAEEAEQWVKKGWKLCWQGRHEEGVLWYRKAVERGLASAQNRLASAYECGHGVPKDDNQAALWYRRAAEQGDPDGQFMLAVMYLEGRGVLHSPEQAISWFRKSADQGDDGAQFMLGEIYEAGEIVPQDYDKAAYWYLQIAANKDADDDGWFDIPHRLGHMYENGLGVPKDLEQAAHWYRKAAEQGNEPAKAALVALASETRYQQISPEEKNTVLDNLKAVTEQGLLSLGVKPSFLGIDPRAFVGPQHTFEGNPLPEFCSISRDILDCFATALLSTPDLEFPASPLVMRCRLGEERKKLMLYLTAMLVVGEQTLPLELKEESEVWIGSDLRPLAEVKGIALGSIMWDRNGRDSFFFFDYPGKMIRDKVPGLGAPGGDGKPRWPECELLLDSVPATLRETAKRAIDFVESTPKSLIQ